MCVFWFGVCGACEPSARVCVCARVVTDYFQKHRIIDSRYQAPTDDNDKISMGNNFYNRVCGVRERLCVCVFFFVQLIVITTAATTQKQSIVTFICNEMTLYLCVFRLSVMCIFSGANDIV